MLIIGQWRLLPLRLILFCSSSIAPQVQVCTSSSHAAVVFFQSVCLSSHQKICPSSWRFSVMHLSRARWSCSMAVASSLYFVYSCHYGDVWDVQCTSIQYVYSSILPVALVRQYTVISFDGAIIMYRLWSDLYLKGSWFIHIDNHARRHENQQAPGEAYIQSHSTTSVYTTVS